MGQRFALVSTSYPAAPGDSSGHFVETQALALAASGAEVHVVVPGPPGERRAGPLRVWSTGGERIFGHPGAAARFEARPIRALDALPFAARAARRLSALAPLDHVFAHFLVPCAFPIALGTRAPLTAIAHGADVRFLLSMPRTARAVIVQALLDRGARLRFVAERLRDALLGDLEKHRPELARALVAASTVEPMPIALAVTRVKEDAKRLRQDIAEASPGRPLWVACGRLIPTKGVDRAIRLSHERGAFLVVVGDGPERAALERLAKGLSACTRFVGQCPREQALAWIAAADRLVHLSTVEAAPTSVREARLLDVPVLAAAAGDVPLWAARDGGIELFEEG